MYDPNGEPARVTLKLLEAFGDDVQDAGADFLMVHLPVYRGLDRLLDGPALPYEALLDELE